MKPFLIKINTDYEGMYDITSIVQDYSKQSKVQDGIIVLFTTHTSAAITINENADPDVKSDVMKTLDQKFPKERYHEHMEGNSDAHVKSSLVGPSLSLIVQDGKMILGTWQGIYFMEFDGPRTRNVYVKIMEGK